MTYEKKQWVNGEDITAASLNNLETQYDQALAWVKLFGLGAEAKDLAVNTDLNTLDATGFYRGSTLVNSPTGVADSANFFFIINIKHSTTTKVQLAFRGFRDANEVYTRQNNNGAWTSWERILTTTNGVQKAGDTMTGSLEIFSGGTGYVDFRVQRVGNDNFKHGIYLGVATNGDIIINHMGENQGDDLNTALVKNIIDQKWKIGGVPVGKTQKGVFNTSLSAVASRSINVTFPVAFAAIPAVVATAGNSLYYCSVSNVTTTGFTVTVTQYEGVAATVSSLPINWIAVE